MLSARVLAAAAAALALAGCATAPARPVNQPTRDPVGQPLRDLGVIRDVAPPVLTAAAAAPYREVFGCGEIAAELAQLDAALGPDVDSGAPAVKGSDVIGDLVSGALGLPYRGIVRKLSGADARERELQAAVRAGMARRGFLKGSAARQGCPPAGAPA